MSIVEPSLEAPFVTSMFVQAFAVIVRASVKKQMILNNVESVVFIISPFRIL